MVGNVSLCFKGCGKTHTHVRGVLRPRIKSPLSRHCLIQIYAILKSEEYTLKPIYWPMLNKEGKEGSFLFMNFFIPDHFLPACRPLIFKIPQ